MMDEATKAKNIRVGKMYALSFEHFALVRSKKHAVKKFYLLKLAKNVVF